MVFKLVRTDTEEPCKIQLPVGTHSIGRGKFLECDDKRVSRNHGKLEVTDDCITITALHTNPCFIIKKGTLETQILKQSNTADLNHGDKFGLLPHSHWYEVLLCSIDITRQPADGEVNNKAETVRDKATPDLDNSQEMLSFDMNETIEERPDSQSLIPTQRIQSPSFTQPASPLPEPGSPMIAGNESPSLIPAENQNSETQDYDANVTASDQSEPRTPKRGHSPDPADEPKRAKIEPVDVKEEPDDIKPGPSNNQAGSSTADNGGRDGAPAAPVNPAGPGRERCMYGANCYRKNPQHRTQFSHPCDADWGAGARGVCPWGSGCQRSDPRHWRDHEHPPGTQPAPRLPNPGMQVVQRNGNVYYINAHSVNFYDDHFQVEDSDGDSVDFDYEF